MTHRYDNPYSVMTISFRNAIRLFAVGVTTALLFGLTTVRPAEAQDSHTIRIEDGRVFIDDEQVPAEDLPESLDVTNMSTQLSFTGKDRAFLNLGGHVYLLQDGRLTEVESDQAHDGLVVFFASDGNGGPVRFSNQYDEQLARYHLRSRGDSTYTFYGNALFDQARKMEELRDRLASQKAAEIRVGEIEGTVVELTNAANNTARMAEALPRIQFQTYLESIGDRDAVLFEQLQREQQLELRTRELAQQIRMSSRTAERKKLVEELKAELNTIFELKQANREREIEQLARRLEALETRLAERKELQDEIIEARLNELLGRSDW